MRSVRASDLGEAFVTLHKEVGDSGSPVLVEADGVITALVPLDHAGDLGRLEDALDALAAADGEEEFRRDPSSFVALTELERELDQER